MKVQKIPTAGKIDDGNLFDKQFSEILSRKEGKVLEIGCGKGRFLLNDNFYGVECNEEDVGIGKKEGKNISHEDGRKLGFKDNYFDVVFSTGLIEHYEDFREILDEHYRVLKEGGALLITVPSTGLDGYNSVRMNQEIFGIKNWKEYGRRISKKELKGWFEHYGLEDIKISHIGESFRSNPKSVGWIPTLLAINILFYFLTKLGIGKALSKHCGHSLMGIGIKPSE